MYHFPGLPQYCTRDYAHKKHDRIHHSVGLLLYCKEDSTGLLMKGGKYHSAGLTSGCMYHFLELLWYCMGDLAGCCMSTCTMG